MPFSNKYYNFRVKYYNVYFDIQINRLLVYLVLINIWTIHLIGKCIIFLKWWTTSVTGSALKVQLQKKAVIAATLQPVACLKNCYRWVWSIYGTVFGVGKLKHPKNTLMQCHYDDGEMGNSLAPWQTFKLFGHITTIFSQFYTQCCTNECCWCCN